MIGLERGGLLALLGRICVAGLHRFPELNSYTTTRRRVGGSTGTLTMTGSDSVAAPAAIIMRSLNT